MLTPRAAGVIASAAALNNTFARKTSGSSSSNSANGSLSARGDGSGSGSGASAAAAAVGGGGSADAACDALAAALPLRLGGMLRASQAERKGVCVVGLAGGSLVAATGGGDGGLGGLGAEAQGLELLRGDASVVADE